MERHIERNDDEELIDPPIHEDSDEKLNSIDAIDEPESIHDEDNNSPKKDPNKSLINKLSKTERKLREESKKAKEKEEKLLLLMEENNRLREYSNRADVAATQGWEGSVKTGMELAKVKYRQALDSGDTEKLIESQEEMSKLSARLHELENYKINQSNYIESEKRKFVEEPKINRKEQEIYDPESDENQERGKFFLRNEWANPSSIDYDEDKFEELSIESKRLDLMLKKQGREHLIGSKDYWRKLESNISGESSKMSSGNNFSEYAKKPSSDSRIVGARNSGSSSERNFNLNESQLEMARNAGLTPEQFKKYYLEAKKSWSK